MAGGIHNGAIKDSVFKWNFKKTAQCRIAMETQVSNVSCFSVCSDGFPFGSAPCCFALVFYV